MNYFLLSTVIDGSGGGEAAAAPTTGSFFESNSMLLLCLYAIAVVLGMYFLSIRPNRKKQAIMKDMRDSIVAGDSVLLANGMYGKVVDVTAECYVIEFGTNKGVRIPVIKQEVYAKREPNLTNKVEEEPAQEKKALFGRKKEEDNAE